MVQSLILLTGMLIAAGVWLIRLEGRVNTHEQVDDERFEALEKENADLKVWLTRIESKLDRVIERRS